MRFHVLLTEGEDQQVRKFAERARRGCAELVRKSVLQTVWSFANCGRFLISASQQDSTWDDGASIRTGGCEAQLPRPRRAHLSYLFQ